MFRKLGLVVILSACCTTAALAATQAALPREKIQPAAFPQLAAQIRTDMAPGGRYLIAAPQRAQVDGDLAAMETLLHGHAALNELSETQRVELFNRQERINALLTGHDGDELVCHHEPIVGSHRTQNFCVTRRDMEKATRESQKFMQDAPRTPIISTGSQ